jgi:hypothetical protein
MTIKIPIRHTKVNKIVKDGVPDEERTICGMKPNDADCGYCPDLRKCVHERTT